VKIVLLKGFFGGLQRFDDSGVDGVVNGVASGAIAGGRAIRHAQTGQLQFYGLFIGIGILAIILAFYFFG
jgi:NADH-quinone oxidoreductase subunit L